MTRTTAKYIGLLALAIVLFYWKTLLTNQFTLIIGSEGVNQTYGWLHFWLNSVWHGHIPLWDPYAFGGRPFAGEMQTAAYYPFRLLFALAPLNKNGLISPHFYHVELALTHLLSAIFMFALLRELRRSHFASFIGACAFAMGGMMSRMSWPHYVESCIWLPAILLFLTRALRTESRIRALTEASAGGFCLGMSILTGGVQFSMMQAIVVVSATVYYGVAAATPMTAESRESHSRWYRLAAIAAVICGVGAGIGAAQLLPAYEYGHLSLRFIAGGTFPMADKIPYDRMDHGMWPESVVTGLFPEGFDGKIGGGEAWPWYIGVLPFVFAVIALWKCRSTPWVRYLAGLALFTFLFSMGEYTPVNGILYALVPFLWMAREPSRFLYLISFAFAAMAAFGLDALLDGAGQSDMWAPARPYLKRISIACASAVFFAAVFTQFSLSFWNCVSLLLILASCAWLFRLMQRPVAPAVLVLLAAFVLFDLGIFNWLPANWNVLIAAGDQYQQMMTLRQPAAFIKTLPGLFRIRVSADPEPNVGDIYGVQSLWGGGATLITDFSRLIGHEDLLNVRYHIKPASTSAPGAIYQDAHWKVYEDPGGYPRAWLVHQTIVEPSHDAVFQSLDKPGVDLHKVALIEKPLPRALDAPAAGDSLSFRSYEADRMSLDVSASGSGLLVLSEIYYPGWKATVNGEPAEIRKVDGALRGIVVPRGSDRVVLEYVPLSFYAGMTISLLTGAIVLLAWIFNWRKTVDPNTEPQQSEPRS